MIGAVLGALLAYLVVTARPTSILRRVVLAVCGVLAQFGGVTLAFAFIATVGFSGVLTEALRSWPGIDIFGGGWLFDLPGLILVYTYFQIPLMVIVFMPALHGVRPQWREAAINLGQHPAVLDPGRVPAPATRLPRVDAAAVRQRVRGVRDGGGPGQPGQPDHAIADPGRADQRDAAGPKQIRVRPGARDGRRGGAGDGCLRLAAPTRGAVAAVTGSVVWRVTRWLLLLLFAAFFAIPLLSMLDFSTQVPVAPARPGATWWRTRLSPKRSSPRCCCACSRS